MTDGPDRTRRRTGETAETPVTALASRAVAVLAERREKARAPKSEHLLEHLIDACIRGSNPAVEAAIGDLLHSGCPSDEILDFYIPEAARRLGDGWCSDALGFAEVSIGTARLQHAVRTLSQQPGQGRSSGEGHLVLLVVPSGEQHTLGAVVMTEQLRRRGISVRLIIGEPHGRVARTVASGQYDAIFFSVSSGERLAQLRDLIEKCRNALSFETPIAVGGAIGSGKDNITDLAGADCLVRNVHEALERCGLTTSPSGGVQPAKKE